MTSKKFLKVCLITFIFCFSFYLIYAYNSPRNNTTIIYYVPSDFEGKCYRIYYNQEGEPPLTPKKVKGKFELTIKFLPDGKLLTSSNGRTLPDIGWYKVKAYIINDDGVVLGEIPNEDVGGSSTNLHSKYAYSTLVFDGSRYCH